MATVGRAAELAQLLESLRQQTYRRFEVIIVDQNPDDRVGRVIAASGKGLAIVHLHSDPGVSLARNVGLAQARGQIISYPDDDCWYPPDLLANVARFLVKTNFDGVAGREVDATGTPPRGWDSTAGLITRFNVWRRAKGFSFFVRHEVASQVGSFDEQLGPGSPTPWGAGEDTDYVLRAVEARFRIWYAPSIFVFHPFFPYPRRFGSPEWIDRAYTYGRGVGRVMRKHHYPLWFVAYYWLRPLVGSLVEGLRGGAQGGRYHLKVLSGRVRGWLERP